MIKYDPPVEAHYHREGLYEKIVNVLNEQGITKVTRNDLAAVDEFHVRGVAVSLELAKEAGFDEDSTVLDVGCGIGGPCRMIADEFGCKVTGVDITAEFIRTAAGLSELVGLQHLTTFIQADALQLPFEDELFDAVWTQHVQMNIADKQRFYSEIKRVLKNRGRFIYYDIFSTGNGPLVYPLPWAGDESISHLITIPELEGLLAQLGFTKLHTKDQTAAGIEFFTNLLNKIAKDGPPKLGLGLLIGSDAGKKFSNLLNSLKDGKVELQSGIYRRDVLNDANLD
ncbi:MAG: methyltransferase domain-containing protein [Chitinophagaceae bacterium]